MLVALSLFGAGCCSWQFCTTFFALGATTQSGVLSVFREVSLLVCWGNILGKARHPLFSDKPIFPETRKSWEFASPWQCWTNLVVSASRAVILGGGRRGAGVGSLGWGWVSSPDEGVTAWKVVNFPQKTTTVHTLPHEWAVDLPGRQVRWNPSLGKTKQNQPLFPVRKESLTVPQAT